MRILLVDAYSSTDKMSDKFAELSKTIKQIVLEQKELVDREDIKIFERTRANLDDFLFEIDSSYLKKSAAKLFDHIELVVIEGDVSLLPWFPQADKVNTLIRMCIRSKKLLFASGFAMQAIVFLCASNLDKMVRVINGNGRGGKIGEALNFHQLTDNMNPYNYFLDNVTGDLYAFNFDSHEWVPKVNAGIHFRRAAEAFDSIGKYVLKQPVYKPKPIIESPLAYLSKNDEEFCNIKKIYLGHWAFSGVSSDFKIPFRSQWDVHHFNFINNLKTFTVLAETKYGPQIIYLAPNCIATQFNISKKFPDTVQILKNFIVYKMRELKSSQDQNTTSIEKISMQLKGSMAVFEIALSQHNSKVGNASAGRRYALISKSSGNDVATRANTEVTEIPHSGFAVKARKEIVTVKNNTVGMNYATQIQKLIESWDVKTPKSTMANPSTTKAGELHDFKHHIRKITPIARINRGAKDPLEQTQGTKVSERAANYLKKLLSNSVGLNSKKNEQDVKTSSKEGEDFQTHMGKAEIRKALYPSISVECLTEEDSWVPGNLSAKKKYQTPTRPRIRLDSTSSSRFYTRYNKDFKSFDYDHPRDSTTLRCSSIYMTEQKIRIQEEKESKKKNIGSDRFKFQTKNSKPDFIPNYVTIDLSEPISNHKFRETYKDKWIAGEMRV